MKLDSKYFDSIRPKKKNAPTSGSLGGTCGMKNCEEKGEYQALTDGGKRIYYCLKHIREHNNTYDYFSTSDTTEAQAQAEQHARMSGGRPTWKLGARHAKHQKAPRLDDPLEILHMRQGSGKFNPKAKETRKATGLSLKSLKTLGLPSDANPETIKQRFKALAKQHHPDLNGGDRSGEAQLKEYIQAYNMLKSNGFC